MKYTVVTTFNLDGYAKYGQRMIQTFLQTWPVDLVVYAEGCQVQESSPRLTVHDLAVASPELQAFKAKWQNVPKATPGIVTSSVSPAPSTKEPAFNVQVTAHVSLNKPRNWSLPRRDTTAEAVAIINLLNVKIPPPEGEGKGCYQEGTRRSGRFDPS